MSSGEADQLLRRCQQGDESALDELVRLYQDRIFQLAVRALGDATLAQEVTADALLKVWTKAGQWRGDASAATWIYQVAVRTILDARRSRARWWRRWSGAPADTVADARPDPAAQLAHSEQQQQQQRQLHEALAQLSEEDRVLVHLYYFEDRSLPEIEAILGVGRATLKTRLARTRQRLRARLEEPDESW
ncbi:MAG: RNA polymerase sigma factor [Gemmataceae bacterium]|nr:RNA polymerase sigma factor [Gemmataceae bacterium]